MSQRRQKKQLTTLDNVNSLTDQELREALKGYNQSPGPITDSTRNIYRKKLASLMEEGDGEFESHAADETSLLLEPPPENDDDDTSDEDYNVQEEESGESELDEETDPDDDVDETSEEDVKLSSTTQLSESAIHPKAGETGANRISKWIMILMTLFFITLFTSYIYSVSGGQSPPSLKNLTKQLITLLLISPVFLVIYKTIGFFKKRRDIETQRVCELVKDALELLQSPDNPKGQMPILHIRDTLLTPSERKDSHMINLWTKAVKFVEEHESRVKVELINIDGEDFRAWKWIGSRKV